MDYNKKFIIEVSGQIKVWAFTSIDELFINWLIQQDIDQLDRKNVSRLFMKNAGMGVRKKDFPEIDRAIKKSFNQYRKNNPGE